MSKGGRKAGLVSIKKLARRTAKRIKTLKRIYSELCASGVPNDAAAFFADNFHTVLSCADVRPSPKDSRRVYFDGGFKLAEALLRASEDRLPDTDEALLALRKACENRRVYGCEFEYLAFELTYTLIERICLLVKNWDRELIRCITLLGSLGSLDAVRINDVLNPVAIKLSEDRAYRESDPRTRLCYREAVYGAAEELGIDELKLCDDLLEKYRGTDLDINSLPSRKCFLPERAALACALALFAAAAAVSVITALWADAPAAALLLFLPAVEALRPFSDMILRRGRGTARLMRFDSRSEEVKNTKTAIVLSAAVSDPEDAERLYDRLLKLHCLNPSENILICALADLHAEQVPTTSEDRAVIESLGETVSRLNGICEGKFSCIVRKRSFSETQQEYMGALRKRGALMDAAKYMKTGDGDFYAALGAVERLVGTEYICAVDSDTQPLMDSVTELLSIALHPSNRVKIENGRVVSGYGMICPRMVTRLGDSLRTEFAKSLGGIGSRSSYDEESSNLYQDVFGSGTFCGKGLISVAALLECTGSLKSERILSHDILEGELLRTAYAGDVCFTEGFPSTPQSYYRRADRWIRGDFQNLPELFSKKYGVLSKLKLADNLRRAATPPAVFSVMFLGFFIYPPSAAITALAALIFWLFPSVMGTVSAFLSDRTLGRRFYSGLLSSASQNLRYILYSTVMLPTLSVKSVRAIFTALLRLITGRRLLDWTTSDALERAGSNPIRFYLWAELSALSLLWSPDYFIRLMGAVFSSMPALLSLNDAGIALSDKTPKYRDVRELSKQFADMWGFFEKYVTRADNDLPPDNVQFSPVYRVAHRTSPTNIGLYMLSALAACDRRLISPDAALSRLERTLNTVVRLEKYRGNLYNWYDTQTLELCPQPYVSSVDSGNFICCLVALKEGLKELGNDRRADRLVSRIEEIIGSCDFSAFYDGVRGLMAIGIDPKTLSQSPNRYDYLMSEARLTSFWAIASRQVPKSHWLRLSRSMLSSGFFGGAASYSGTMFEFFMPEIFLKSPEGSLFGESLRYALWVQKKYAKSLGRPYGISESGYYSFDSALNYRYMAHGVPNTGVRRGLENSYVVSPYSTYISLCFAGAEGPENLRKIAEYGMYGSYGLYEALDFTASGSEKPEPVRSYMAHHVGMSLCSLDNYLGGGIIQKRFMRDLRVRGALELLDERFHLGTAVFENNLLKPKQTAPEPRESETEILSGFSLSKPRVKLICNGEMTLMIADNGACASIYRSENVYRRTRDLMMRPTGIFSFISDGGDALSLSYLPDKAKGLCAEFSEEGAAFYRNTKKLSAGMRLRLHLEYPCELRTFALRNETSEALPVSIINYIEPSLQSDAAEEAHPAFSKMFLRLERDPEWNTVIATRVNGEKKIWMGIGFVEEVKECVSFDRGEVLDRPDGISGIGRRFKEIPPSLICEPDPCVFIRASLELPPKAEAELTLFLVCADSREELINRVSEIRRRRPKFCALPRLDTAAGRVASALLPHILFGGETTPEKREAVIKNRLPLRALWELSVATDIPMALVVLNSRNDSQKLSAYLGAYKLLRLCGLSVQLVFAFDDGGRYERAHYSELISAAKELGLEGSVYSSGGILPLDLSRAREGLFDLCRAAACHICTDEIASEQPEINTLSYAEIKGSSPIPQKVELPVARGGFTGSAYVVNEKPPLPWCHILSNPVFGTLVSEGSLGFTYAFNSRENRLTPWDNDPERDNLGERLLLKTDGGLFDLIRGAAAVFSPYKAEYYSRGEGYECRTEVGVSAKGMCKKISVELRLKGKGKLCYYAEPCMGADRSRADMIIPKKTENGLILGSSASEIPGHMYLSASKSACACTDRESFLCGNWEECAEPSAGLIGAVWCNVGDGESLSFYLSYGLSERAALEMPRRFRVQTDTRERKIELKTGSEYTDLLANVWLRYQALHARIYARTGFYQCSGAYGFRDQLQDAVGIVSENPGALKTQILRCCTAQFKEGDVMHWWHTVVNRKPRGIRTRISDDALWLPYAVCEYADKTGDLGLLELKVCWCDGIELKEGERERYGEVFRTSRRDSVYEHCRRAIDFRLGKTGENGLMLIGTGDWNDGFGSVGKDGRGESVWLSEFFIIVLKRFSELSKRLGDCDYAEKLAESAEKLCEAVESRGREQGQYLRGYFDDGSELGSPKSRECRIDAIAQAFAEFAGLGSEGFSRAALERAYSELADIKRGVVKLFTPAFSDGAEPDPGYVRFYPSGMRENGGQYTHGAVWLGIACLKAGLTEEGGNILEALSPINRALAGCDRYKTEPYYLCGDVYANKNCFGRGGWSIYTGSAAWYYRAIREGLCGVSLREGKLRVDPRAPKKAEVKDSGGTV